MKKLSVMLMVVSALMIFICACGEKSGNSEKNYAVSKDEIVKISNGMISELEEEASSEDNAAFEELKKFVEEYNYGTASVFNLKADDSGNTFQIEPQSEDELWKMTGIALFLQGSVKSSLRAFLEAVIVAPETASNLGQAGTALNQLGKTENALTFLETAKSLDDKDDAILMSLAYSYKMKGELSKAETELKNAVAANPDAKMAGEILSEMYLKDNPDISNLRNEMFLMLYVDIIDVFEINSTDEAVAFTTEKNGESSVLAQELLNSAFPQGGFQNYDFYDTYMEKYDAYLQVQDEINTWMNDDLTETNNYFYEKEEALHSSIFSGNSCASSPEAACQCAKNYVEGTFAILNDDVYEMLYDGMNSYLEKSIDNLIPSEMSMNSFIYSSAGVISENEYLWAYNYLYKNLELNNKNTALGIGNYFSNMFAMHDQMTTHYNYATEMCNEMEEAKQRLEELERQLEDERQKKIEEMEALKEKEKMKKKEADFSGEGCLDSVFCLGIEGSSVSLKIGGPVFAQFSVDTSKFDIGVRVGVGAGDPTGNVAGYDLSVGGTIGSSGTTFDIKASQSYNGGTIKRDYSLFNSSFNW